ncbi:MAG: preprotein translocase subunit SecG [Sneathiellaceae bacterium]
MITIALILHLIFAIALIGVVLLQRSEGGALGMGGGGGGGGGLVSSRGAASFLTRTTAVLAACFIATSLGLAILAQQSAGPPRSLLDGTGGAGGLTPLTDDLVPGQGGAAGEGTAPASSAPASSAPAGGVSGSESLTPSAAPEN